MELWPSVFYLISVILTIGGMLLVSNFLGQRHRDRATNSPYEAGILSEGTARIRISSKFYLVAVFFVIFDLETVFIVSWAIAGRELGWSGFWEILIFIMILLAALLYLWRLGALDWGPKQRTVTVPHAPFRIRRTR